MTPTVSVAIPVLNGGERLRHVLGAVRDQRVDADIELLVADSGSTDGSVEAAREGASTVIEVERYSHGGTRNLLMERSRGAHVAFLTQDAMPADSSWLERLLEGFSLAPDVALVYGPYRPRVHAPVAVAREIDGWFSSLAPDGEPRLDRNPGARGPSPETFFADANAAVARWAWERVAFRPVPYAEDQALALDMLHAGFAKVFLPDAAVLHSHEYGALDQFRRSFDEWRGLREIHGWVEPARPLSTLLAIQHRVRGDVRSLRDSDTPRAATAREAVRSIRHWTVRTAGAVTGSRADRLPPPVRRWCSLERRGTFVPSHDLHLPR